MAEPWQGQNNARYQYSIASNFPRTAREREVKRPSLQMMLSVNF